MLVGVMLILSLKNSDIPYPVNRIIVINRINVTIFIYIIN